MTQKYEYPKGTNILAFSTEIGELSIPLKLVSFFEWIVERGFSVWLVGGVVRDFLMGKPPKDWDIATDASFDDLKKSGFKTIPLGARFGILDVIVDKYIVEVTDIRKTTESGDIESDLARRDFTINAMAVEYPSGKLLDPFRGIKDLKRKKLRAVLKPEERFSEDPLRIIRAARFVSELGFKIVPSTLQAMKTVAPGISRVAIERIREEMFRILLGAEVFEAFEILRKVNAFPYFFPEILEGWRKKQNEFHKYSIYYHILHTVANVTPKLRVRLAALFHDIGKARCRIRKGGKFHFYGHEKESELIAREVLTRWRVSSALIDDVCILVRNHMVYGFDRWSDSAIRRLISRLGEDLIDDFLELIKADRISHGTKNGADIHEVEVLRDRIYEQIRRHRLFSVKDLAINGHDVMEILGLKEGPQVGKILHYLYKHVLEKPQDNRKDILISIMLSKFAGPAQGPL